MILALDPATKLGWATATQSGTIHFRRSIKKNAYERLQHFRDWLVQMIHKHSITHIVYEKPVGGQYLATRSHSHFEGIIMLVCLDHLIEYTYISPGAIKKFATGKGNATKELMMSAYRRKYGKEPLDDNECDARFLHDFFVTSERQS